MKDAHLLKQHVQWVAYVSLDQGKAATLLLAEPLSDAEAIALNALPIDERIARIQPLLRVPLPVVADVLGAGLLTPQE